MEVKEGYLRNSLALGGRKFYVVLIIIIIAS